MELLSQFFHFARQPFLVLVREHAGANDVHAFCLRRSAHRCNDPCGGVQRSFFF